MRSYISILIISITILNLSYGQELSYKIPEHTVGITVTKFIAELESTNKIKFFYLSEWTNRIVVRKSYAGQDIKIALEYIFKGRGINLEYIYGYGVVLLKDYVTDKIRREVLNNLDKSIDNFSFGDSTKANWGEDVTFKGQIKEDKFNEPVVGATLYANEVDEGTVTDPNGYFNLKLPVGEHLISVKALNYESQNFFLKLYANGKLDLIMEENPIILDEIVVKDNAEKENFENIVSGKTRLTAKTIGEIPSFLGEVDVIKSIQLLPGVNTVGEGSAGFNVRGGSADQNLILLDDGIIFNPNHLFGFFSAFHPDALKEVTFYRGAIPAQFGGRISSVLDVKQKDGNANEYHGSGGLGIVTSRLMFEGPILKDKLSFLFAGRSSYSDWILNSVKNDDVRNSSAFFYDITGKLSAYINKKNRLTASYYLSKDKFKFANDTTYRWQNSSIAINHERYINSKTSHITSLSGGNYGYEVRDEDSDESFSWKYGINNFQLKSFVTFGSKNHLITAGIDLTGYEFERGRLSPLSDASNIKNVQLINDYSLIAGVFVSDEIQIGEKLTLLPGLRFSSFGLYGPHDHYTYASEEDKDDFEIIDTLRYASGDIATRYSGIEPRFSAKFKIDNNNFFKAGYSRAYQYIHLISNTAAITPIDSWVPSSKYVEPQIGNQYSVGFFKRVPSKRVNASVEVFYKNISNVPEYKDGAELALKQNVETELVNSEADIRGLELSIQKDGRLSGEINYTFTSSRRKTSTSVSELQINNNEFFPSNYDQPHNIKLNANYDISKRHVFSVNFNLASGRPISAPVESFTIDRITVTNYTERNQYRIPIYHRLDLSILIRTSHKKDKKWEGNWTFTIYNVYSRRNAYSVFFDENENGRPTAYKLSILGSIFPSVTYNFKF
jgi:hypothetical protein